MERMQRLCSAATLPLRITRLAAVPSPWFDASAMPDAKEASRVRADVIVAEATASL